MNASILVVDDERAIQDSIAWCLRADGHDVRTAPDGEEAMEIMAGQDFDVVISDIIMPGVSGLELLRKARTLHPRRLVLLIPASATVETAVEALREGASDYVLKPFKFDDLRHRVQRLLDHRAAFQESARFREAVESASLGNRLLGESAAMQAVRAQVAKSGPALSNLLITGESGTGKELVARAIHAASPRRQQPFVPINCGAIPESLLESQLFGHVSGAFTIAVQTSPGMFAAAEHGTGFLDEIGEMPVHVQVKLLRVIEERQVWAVGSVKPRRIDIRIVASTNEVLTVRDLPRGFLGGPTPQGESLREVSRQSERQHIMAVLAQTRFDKREAARILGISLASLYRKLGERRISDSPLQD